VQTTVDGAADQQQTEEQANRAFSVSMLISAVRCTLTYVVFPWLLPALHLGSDIGPAIGLVVGPIAIVSNVFSIRRFWRADHRYKIPVTCLNVAMIVLVSALVVGDIADLT